MRYLKMNPRISKFRETLLGLMKLPSVINEQENISFWCLYNKKGIFAFKKKFSYFI